MERAVELAAMHFWSFWIAMTTVRPSSPRLYWHERGRREATCRPQLCSRKKSSSPGSWPLPNRCGDTEDSRRISIHPLSQKLSGVRKSG